MERAAQTVPKMCSELQYYAIFQKITNVSTYAHEVQSIHFGASKNSITLHTGAIFFNDKCQTFATVSDNNCHEPEAIWAHLIPVIKYARERYPEISVIHFFRTDPLVSIDKERIFFC